MKKIIIGIVVLIVVIWAYRSSTSQPAVAPSVDNASTTTVVNGAPKVPAKTTTTAPKDDSILKSTPTINPATVTSTANVPVTVPVLVKDFKFSPAALTVKKGTTIIWTNNDGVPHTVTSDTGTTLKSPTLANGQSFTFTFTTVGTFDYHCSLHTSMKGSVIVTN